MILAKIITKDSSAWKKFLGLVVVVFIFKGALMAHSLPKFYEQHLDNNLTAVVVPLDNNTGVIVTNVIYKVGSGDEFMGQSGIAHMLEHLNFKSTKNLEAGEFDKIVKSEGGVNNASTGFDYTHYFIKSSSENMDTSLKLYADIMENLSIKDSEFQVERDVVLEERRWRTDNSLLGYLYFKLFNNAYVYHPYHWTPIGFANDIENWKVEDIREFHKKFYQPKNAIVLIVGDVDKDTAFKSIKKYFGDIKNTTKVPKRYTKEPLQGGKKDIVLHRDTKTPMIAIAYHTTNFDNPQGINLLALGTILGDGRTSRLYKSLINDKNIANSIYAGNTDTKDPGLFMIFVTLNPEQNLEEAKNEVFKEIEKLKNKPISNSELKKIKNMIKTDFISSLDGSMNISSIFGDYLAKGDMKPLLNFQENIEKLSAKDIQNAAKKYFVDDNSTTIILKD